MSDNLQRQPQRPRTIQAQTLASRAAMCCALRCACSALTSLSFECSCESRETVGAVAGVKPLYAMRHVACG